MWFHLHFICGLITFYLRTVISHNHLNQVGPRVLVVSNRNPLHPTAAERPLLSVGVW